MVELWICLGAAILGVGLGVFYFGSLWLTLRWLSELRHPVLWVLVSLVGRLSVALAAFYSLLETTGLLSLIVALLSFLVVRMLLVYRTLLAINGMQNMNK